MKVKSTNPSMHGQYNKYKKKIWVKVEDSNELEIEIEVYDTEIIDDLLVLYDKKGKLIIREKSRKQHLNLLV